jgi:PAS domain S-box-containing protein
MNELEQFAELDLKDSEIRYRRLFEAAQDGILILDAKTGSITDVNPFLINLLGYSHDGFISKRLWEVDVFRDIEAGREAFESLQDNEYIRYEDLPLKAKDGRLIQVEFVSNVYMVDNKKVIQCNIRDITTRKQAEKTQKKMMITINNCSIIRSRGVRSSVLIGAISSIVIPQSGKAR